MSDHDDIPHDQPTGTFANSASPPSTSASGSAPKKPLILNSFARSDEDFPTVASDFDELERPSDVSPYPTGRCAKACWYWNELPLVVRILIGSCCGLLIGIIANILDASDNTVSILSYIGELYIRVLTLIVLPLLAVSMTLAPNKLEGDVRQARSIGKLIILYYLATTVLAAVEGLLLVNIFQPGRGDAGTCATSVVQES
eukprot:709979_1